MEGIILIGIQGSGKSSYYKEYFFDSHIRISLDLLKTRYREKKLLLACLETSTRVVIDNTNPTRKDRERYFGLFKQFKYRIEGYFFESEPAACLIRNSRRARVVPERGVWATYHKLELPTLSEGFNKLYYIKIQNEHFETNNWYAK